MAIDKGRVRSGYGLCEQHPNGAQAYGTENIATVSNLYNPRG